MIKVISYYLLNFQLWKFKSFLLKSKYNRIERELYKQEDGQSYRMLFIEFPMMKFRIFKSFLLRRNVITKWLNDQEDDGIIKAVTKINQGVASRFLRIISKQSILVIKIGRQIERKHNFSHSVVRTMKNPVTPKGFCLIIGFDSYIYQLSASPSSGMDKYFLLISRGRVLPLRSEEIQ